MKLKGDKILPYRTQRKKHTHVHAHTYMRKKNSEGPGKRIRGLFGRLLLRSLLSLVAVFLLFCLCVSCFTSLAAEPRTSSREVSTWVHTPSFPAQNQTFLVVRPLFHLNHRTSRVRCEFVFFLARCFCVVFVSHLLNAAAKSTLSSYLCRSDNAATGLGLWFRLRCLFPSNREQSCPVPSGEEPGAETTASCGAVARTRHFGECGAAGSKRWEQTL